MKGNKDYRTLDDLPSSIPIFPLTGALLLPRGQLPLNIFEPRYVAMIDAALASDRMIGIIQPALETSSEPNQDLCQVGCAGRLISFTESGDGRYLITLYGACRFKIEQELEAITPFRQVRPDWTPFLDDLKDENIAEDVNREELLRTFRSYLDANDMEADWDSIQNTETEMLVNALSMMSPYGPAEKQALLEAETLKARADTLIAITEFSLARNDADGDTILQ